MLFINFLKYKKNYLIEIWKKNNTKILEDIEYITVDKQTLNYEYDENEKIVHK